MSQRAANAVFALVYWAPLTIGVFVLGWLTVQLVAWLW